MRDIYNLSVKDTLPSSITADGNIQALSELLSIKLLDLVPSIDTLAILPNLSKQSEAVLDELAWHLHVDFYDYTLTRSQKETLIYKSIAWHRRKATVGTVEEIVSSVYSESVVAENWERQKGEPYTFDIKLYGNMMSPKMRNKLITLLSDTKNVRSWLGEIEYANPIGGKSLYIGGHVSSASSATIGPNLGTSADNKLTEAVHVGSTVKVYQHVHI